MHHCLRTWILAVSLLGLLVAQTAFAEPNAPQDGDYSYRFKDEDLLGETLSGLGDLYTSRPKTARVLLLRPRTSLIREIVLSVEDL